MVFQLPQGSSCLDGLRIIFVDASADERHLFCVLFEQLGAEVTPVGTADEAIVALEQNGADLIVSEITLSSASGLDLMRRVRALPVDRGGKVPAIAVTAVSQPRITDEALVAGFTTVVAKPYAPETLVAVVRELMPQIDELRRLRMRSRAQSHQAFREQLRVRRVRLQKRHAQELAASGTEQERHFAKKMLALLTAQDFGETHFCAPLDDVEIAPAMQLEDGLEGWTATAVCGQELLTIELVVGPKGEVAVRKMESARAVLH